MVMVMGEEGRGAYCCYVDAITIVRNPIMTSLNLEMHCDVTQCKIML